MSFFSILFLIIVDGFSRAISETTMLRNFQGIRMGRNENLTHLFFVDDVFLFFNCVEVESEVNKKINLWSYGNGYKHR